MNENNDPNLRRVDLLIQNATHGLSDNEARELEQLNGSPEELKRFEAVAAAFDLSLTTDQDAGSIKEKMPNHLRDQLLISAGKFLGSESDEDKNELASRKSETETAKKKPAMRWREAIAVTVMAASLLLVISGFNPFASNRIEPAASSAKLMTDFIDRRPIDLIDVPWQPVHSPLAGGKVLWSDSAQEGYMVFDGLKINDPTVEQYQLWIFDTDPAQATPVDGGVFDITAADIDAEGNVVIPIKATVPVDRAVQFAVTVERPGGVYVSKREKIPVLATIPGLE